jgi:hypothetical protein
MTNPLDFGSEHFSAFFTMDSNVRLGAVAHARVGNNLKTRANDILEFFFNFLSIDCHTENRQSHL